MRRHVCALDSAGRMRPAPWSAQAGLRFGSARDAPLDSFRYSHTHGVETIRNPKRCPATALQGACALAKSLRARIRSDVTLREQ